ncbi:unnamed protein product [Ixodes hexagonus]
MRLAVYNSITQKLQTLHRLNRLDELKSSFPDVPEIALRSIITFEIQRKTKRSYHRFSSPASLAKHYQHYVESVRQNALPGFLLRYADELGVPPALLARLVVIKHHEADEGGPPSKQDISQMMKDTSTIEDGCLAAEVFLCIMSDDEYGPLADALRHNVGLEHEVHLKEQLRALGVCFVDEEVLRERGYDKTPDVKLEVPVVVDGLVVNWIESKALFGDPESHRGYMRDQYQSYWNRFGRGLVIYWYGFVDELASGDAVILRDHLPTNVVHMEAVCGFT